MTTRPRAILPFAAAALVAVAGCSSSGERADPAVASQVPAPAATTAQAPSPSPTPTPTSTPTASPSARASATPAKGSPEASPASPSAAPRSSIPQPPPGARVDCSTVKCVALTFDDGPGKDTPRLLRTLTDKGAVATFFQQGVSLQAFPDAARQVASTPGMEIGEHSWNHPQLTNLGRDGVTSQLQRTHAKIKELTGRDVTLMRPPYGARNSTVDAVAKQQGEAVVVWDVDTLDWQSRNAVKVRAEVKRQVRPGSIVLMHDIHPTTVDAVPGILDDLKADGYVFVTVSQLEGGSTVPGKVYPRLNG